MDQHPPHLIEKIQGLLEHGELTDVERRLCVAAHERLDEGGLLSIETMRQVESLYRREFYVHEMKSADDALERRVAAKRR